MSPIEQYNSIIDYWRKNPLKRGGEVHHIIPRSCGGCDKKWNKVRMPTLEHIRCHGLLCEIYPTGSEHDAMAIAYDLMLTSRDGVKVSPEEAARARDEARKAKTGKPSPKKGKPATRPPWNKGLKIGPHTDEWKQKVSAKLTGRKASDERRRKISEALTGKPKSDEARKHMSENHADVSKMKDPVTGRFIRNSCRN